MLGWELPPNHVGGLGMVCYSLCKYLSKSGAQIDFILPFDGEHEVIDFMNIHSTNGPLPLVDNEVSPSVGAYNSSTFAKTGAESTLEYHQDKYISGVAQKAKVTEFDVIHAHDWLTIRAAIAAKQQKNKPLFLHIHATEYDRSGGNEGNPYVRDIEYQGMMLADKIFAVSEYVKRMIVSKYAIPEEKITVIHNSVDKDYFTLPEEDEPFHSLQLFKNQGYKVVSNIGRLTIQKNLVNLMYVMARVIIKQPKTIFLLVGSGEQRDELVELSASLGISSNVLFVPFQNGTRVKNAYRISDLFVMPSVSEPFGITPLEAIGFNTPVLISKQSGVSEILLNALKVDFWDIDEMANQITATLRYDSLSSELLKNQKTEWSKTSWHGAAERIMNSYKEHHNNYHQKAFAV